MYDHRLSAIIEEMAHIASPPPKRSAWEWAEAHRILPKSAAEPGAYRADRSPWVKAFTDAIAHYKYTEVIAVTGSQVAKTDGIILNAVGWRMMDNPTPTLIYMPTEKSALSLSKDRLAKMFKSVPILQNAINMRKRTNTEMFINGVRLGLGWGGSATEVASHPAGLVVFDELDRIKDIPGEGSAWELTIVRGSTYPNFKQVGTSTPTLGKVKEEKNPETGLFHWKISKQVYSLSWSLWQDGTRHEFMLPCPDCRVYFAPKSKLLWYPEGCTPREAEKNVRLTCPHCGVQIDHKKQDGMISGGKMIAPGQTVLDGEIVGNPPDSTIYSGHVNGLCSRWVSWGRRASDLVRVNQTEDEGRIQGVINTRFGELYHPVTSKSVDWEVLQKICRGHLLGEVPEGVGWLTAGVDVQGNRLVWAVVGWKLDSRELAPYLIDYGEFFGETSQLEVWEEQLRTDVLYGEWQGVPLKSMAVDSGYNPSSDPNKSKPSSSSEKNRNIVYDFCRDNRKALPIKGSPNPMSRNFNVSVVDLDVRGKPLKMGLRLWIVDTDNYKNEIYTRIARALKQDENGNYCTEKGSLHLAQDTGHDFLRQLVSEERTVSNDGKIKWIMNYKDNHFLDCVMSCFFQADKLRIKHNMENEAQPIPPEEPLKNKISGKTKARILSQPFSGTSPNPIEQDTNGGQWDEEFDDWQI